MSSHADVSLPPIDGNALRWRVRSWEAFLSVSPTANRVIVEWSTGLGPKVFVYPRGNRAVGVHLVETPQVQSSNTGEAWADYLEHDYVPYIAYHLDGTGVRVDVQCADQKPVQIMRQRRRTLVH
jgi:hypothetical protein